MTRMAAITPARTITTNGVERVECSRPIALGICRLVASE